MKIKLFLITIICLWPVTALTQPWTWQVTPSNCSVYGQAYINGSAVEAGDWIGSFNTDGVCCGGYEMPVDTFYDPFYLTIYGADEYYPGADPGEEIELRIYDVSEDLEYADVTILESAGPLIWQSNQTVNLDINAGAISAPDWTWTITPSNCSIYGRASFLCIPLNPFDWIAAFTESGICCGAYQMPPGEMGDFFLTAYGAYDSQPGFVEGEAIHFKLFDASAGIIYDNIAGQEALWTANGTLNIDVLDETPQSFCGDLSGDGEINEDDVNLLIGFILVLDSDLLTPAQLMAADANGDEKLDVLDIILLVSWMIEP
ncbi:MAG: hypothetical protein GY869_01135 [Planctomycetes bacterium]|nr:hypothetical protein [Planctomycetota bacterium]